MPMPTTAWPEPAARTLAEQVYRTVRTRILAGDLAPGAFLREKDLEQMGVSRTPIRDALGRLASEGFLERLPHRGFRVPTDPLAQLVELYPIVAALDLTAGRLALARLTADDLSELRAVNAALADARDRGDVNAMLEQNDRFHRVFAVRSGNRRLAALLDDLRSQLVRLERWYYSHPDRTARSIHEHDAIIAALADGDGTTALGILERNMALTERSLVGDADDVHQPDPTSSVRPR